MLTVFVFNNEPNNEFIFKLYSFICEAHNSPRLTNCPALLLYIVAAWLYLTDSECIVWRYEADGFIRLAIDWVLICQNCFDLSLLLHPPVCVCVMLLATVVTWPPVALAPPVSLLWMYLGESSSSRSESHYEPRCRSGACADGAVSRQRSINPLLLQRHVCLGYLRWTERGGA